MKKLFNDFDEDMLMEFGGRVYVVDLDAASESVILEKVADQDNDVETEDHYNWDVNGDEFIPLSKVVRKVEKGREINLTKYELLRWLMTIVLEYDAPADDSLGVDRALQTAPLPFKMAFNTLVANGVIKELK